MSEHPTQFSDAYISRLIDDYGTWIGYSFLDCQAADLAQQPGQKVQYVRLNANRGDPRGGRPVLFVNGYMAGIVANAPFGAEMASRDFDIIMPDQNRHGILKNPEGKKDATYTQAQGMAAIIEAEELTDTPLDVVAHSYGSLVFDSLHRLAGERHWTCFEGAKAVFLAPAGINHYERPVDFLRRYVATLLASRRAENFPDSYWEFEKDMFVPAQANFLANIPRAGREGYEIITKLVDTERLIKRGLDKIALVLFGEDTLYSDKALASSLPQLVTDRVTAFSPVSLMDYRGGIRSGAGAEHNDQQFNPKRVAGAVEQFLRS